MLTVEPSMAMTLVTRSCLRSGLDYGRQLVLFIGVFDVDGAVKIQHAPAGGQAGEGFASGEFHSGKARQKPHC